MGSFVQWVTDGVQNRTTALVVLAIFCGMAIIFNILLKTDVGESADVIVCM